jgi:hypothetical protein
MYPYYIEISNEAGLYKLKDGRFQIIKKGDLSPLMVGYKYILVEHKIAEYFQSLEVERVTFKPAIIWNRRSDIEYSNYQEMVVHHQFESLQIHDIDIDGKQFLLMNNRHLFASPELKSVLINSSLEFKFSKGLSSFAEKT